MRNIKYIVVHCTAGNQNQTVADLREWWKTGMGWKQVGYHKVITKDGIVHTLVGDEVITNGVGGYNSNSLHVSYCGGMNGVDNRTDAQKKSLEAVVKAWHKQYPSAIIQGHRDFPNVKKSCPSFEVSKWLKQIGI